ncbi:MAG: bifunctional 2',3'-cyclic-nucleotide 2'-phosphodiesterase/3'-nucleotidase [Pseudomonadota bacterium]
MTAEAPGTDGASAALSLRILATTDLHMNLLAYDYYADRPSDAVGLARTAALIDAARAEATNCLLFDNGDALQGTPMGDVAAAPDGMMPGETHPMIAAMNALRYDAAALGNHDFGFGPEFTARTVAQAQFPVLSANIAHRLGETPLEDALFQPPYTCIARTFVDEAGAPRMLTIGLLGLLPPQTTLWEGRHLAGRLHTRCMIEAASAWLPRLLAEGPDLVILLAHCGIDAEPAQPKMENAALHLAAMEGVDVVIAGHQHLVFPGPDHPHAPGLDPENGLLAGKPAVLPGFFGSHLGVIDLRLRAGSGGWRVTQSAVSARPIARMGPDGPSATVGDAPAVLSAAAPAHSRTLDMIRRPVGHAARPLTSYFAQVADAPALRLAAEAQAWHLAHLARDTDWADLPQLSAVSPLKAGGRAGPESYTDVPAGPMSLRNIADIFVYPNSFRAVAVTGAALVEWLEMSASQFLRITPGALDAPLIDPAFPSFNFDVIAGLSYQIDLTRPPRYRPNGRLCVHDSRRVTALHHAGTPVAPEARFLVATNDYRVAGGGGFAALTGAELVFAPTETSRDILVQHIAQNGLADPPDAPIWRFVPLPGTTALFDSAPQAALHLPLAHGPRIEAAYPTPGPAGFSRYRIYL